MRTLYTAAIVSAAALALALPASAAYCGPSGETASVETVALHMFNATRRPGWKRIDRTYVMAIVVLDNYAEADIQYAGQMSEYFVKRNGAWHYAGNFLPAPWPKTVRAKLTALFDARGNGSPQCRNPHFVNHPSGG